MKIANGMICAGAFLSSLLLFTGLTGCAAGASNLPVSGTFTRQTMPDGTKDASTAVLVFTKSADAWHVSGVSGVAKPEPGGQIDVASSDIRGGLGKDQTQFVSTNSDGCTFQAHFNGNMLTVDHQDAFCGDNVSFEGKYQIATGNSPLSANANAEAAKTNVAEVASNTGKSAGYDANVVADESYASPVSGKWRTNPNEIKGVVLIALKTRSGSEQVQLSSLEDSGMGSITGALETVSPNHYKVVDYTFPACSVEFIQSGNAIIVDNETVSTDCANRGVSFKGSFVRDTGKPDIDDSASSDQESLNAAQAAADEATEAVRKAIRPENTSAAGEGDSNLVTGTWATKDGSNSVTISSKDGTSFAADISGTSSSGSVGELQGNVQKQSDGVYLVRSDDASCSANIRITGPSTLSVSDDNGLCDGVDVSLNGKYYRKANSSLSTK